MSTPDRWSVLEYNPNGSLTRYIRPCIIIRPEATSDEYKEQFTRMFLEQPKYGTRYGLIYTNRFVDNLTTQESIIKKLIQEIKNRHFFVAIRSSYQGIIHFFKIIKYQP